MTAMTYTFIDSKGTFRVPDPGRFNLYFPLTNQDGTLLSSISPRLAGDIKKDNDRFLTPPASVEDLRGNLLCRRDFFIRTKGGVIRLSSAQKTDVLEAGFLYHLLRKSCKGLSIEVLNFIPYNHAVEVMQVTVVNKTAKAMRLEPTSFIPLFCREEKNLRDHRHVSSLLNRIGLDRYGILLTPTMIFDEQGHTRNENTAFVLGYQDNGTAPAGQFPTLDSFIGESDLLSPEAVYKDRPAFRQKKAEFDGKEVCGALRFRETNLEPGGRATYVILVGMEDSHRRIKSVFEALDSPQKVAASLEATKGYWQRYLSSLEFDFGDSDYNNWLLWVKLQPTLRKLFGCSFLPHFDYGKGGRGWRDLWQDALTLLLTEPDQVRSFILKNFKGVRLDGSNATIITRDGNFISDRNRISRVWMDHGIWPYLTLRLYIQKTGDLGFLLEKTNYFRDRQLSRARVVDTSFAQEDYLLRGKDASLYSGSILEHLLIQNLVSFFNVGRHNVIRLENADWNDGLDMASENGESAAFSFMYAHNLKDLAELLVHLKEKAPKVKLLKALTLLLDRAAGHPVEYGDYRARQKRLDEYFKRTHEADLSTVEVSLESLIRDISGKAEYLFAWLRKHEWLSEGFYNGYYDNTSRRVEGRRDGRLRMMLQSQVFSIMSEGATVEQVRAIWKAAQRYLKDAKTGGFRLNTDFKTLYLDFGRAFGFSYGDKENGAFFNHMAVMFANGLYRRGFVREGFEVFDSIYRMASGPYSQIYPLIPEYFNYEGRGMYLYLTGSASWYIYMLMEEVLGIHFSLGDILIEPKLTTAQFSGRHIASTFLIDKKKVTVLYERGAASTGLSEIREAVLAGRRIKPSCGRCLIRREWLTKSHNTLHVYLK